MARMLRPEKIHVQLMIAPARHSDYPQVIDSCTDKPFESDEDIDQEGQISLSHANICK
jgi:hypothetical protein